MASQVNNNATHSNTSIHADQNIEAGKVHAEKGTEQAKQATRNFFQGTKDIFVGGTHKARHGAEQVGHATIEAAHRSRINSPYALVSPGKGVLAAAALAGAGYLAPQFTTASYAVTLTVPGVAFTAAAVLLAAAVYSWIANIVHKPTVPAGTSLDSVDSSLQEKVEDIKLRKAQIANEEEALHKESAKLADSKLAAAEQAKKEAEAARAVGNEGKKQAA